MSTKLYDRLLFHANWMFLIQEQQSLIYVFDYSIYQTIYK